MECHLIPSRPAPAGWELQPNSSQVCRPHKIWFRSIQRRYWGPKNSLFLYWCFPQLQLHWKKACVLSSTFPPVMFLNYTSLQPLPIVPEMFLIVKQCHVQATIRVSNSSTQHCHGHQRGRPFFSLWKTRNAYSQEIMISSAWTLKGTLLVPVTVVLPVKCSHQDIMLTFNIEEIDHSLK